MSYLVEVPTSDGNQLVVEVAAGDLPAELELAARHGEITTRAQETLEHALDQIQPALHAIRGRLEAMAPSQIELEFGILLGTEAGVVIAKGTTEVHFTVKLAWEPRSGRTA